LPPSSRRPSTLLNWHMLNPPVKPKPIDQKINAR
jgi:hypothetical protein